MVFETKTFIKEDLLDYYKFLFDMMQWSFDWTLNLGMAAPFQLSHPEINLPLYSLPGWNKLVFRVDGMDTTVQGTGTGIVLTLLPDMTIRQTTSSMIFLSTSWIYKLSRDEEGQHMIEDSLIQAAFGITVCWHWDPLVYQIPHQYYEILQTIHEACGFDPCSTQVAEYLGVPVTMINNGHSGLEDCMEDPEYTSESESGDSDYVSASEDA
ncbi:hypothetical protein C8J56DRAFT_890578 [Mycena floridula]|nr:hypothetical protein C8J56DRAFT_890578 [Mycena floridula]